MHTFLEVSLGVFMTIMIGASLSGMWFLVSGKITREIRMVVAETMADKWKETSALVLPTMAHCQNIVFQHKVEFPQSFLESKSSEPQWGADIQKVIDWREQCRKAHLAGKPAPGLILNGIEILGDPDVQPAGRGMDEDRHSEPV